MIDTIVNSDLFQEGGILSLEDDSVDCIITDPPYFRVMTEDWKGEKYEWDKQWDSLEDYLRWFDRVLEQFDRVLKPNGSIYIYADDMIAAHIQVLAEKRFYMLNNIVWKKTNGMNSKYWRNIRKFALVTERILFMEKKGASGLPKTGWQEILDREDSFRSIKDYILSERDRLIEDKGFDYTQFIRFFQELTGTERMYYHYFGDYQWSLPTAEIWEKMQSSGYWCYDYEDLRREYEDLRREYEDLRREYEDLRRPFHIGRNYTDVWESLMTTTMEGGVLHPTQKPVKHIERMIEASTNEGAVVLDPFMGSGTTAVACIRTGRHYVGFEKDPTYHALSQERIEKEKKKRRVVRSIFDYETTEV